ncbi:helix-turn-helix transcriptional regulator [Chlorobium sp. KB01]|uniref:helix-turn-helix domain-containing protein n=1 Tax=Chlorobium sp. KB01 TaxID=1917528 RepID=UPI0009F8950F|nr:helix-turn-helix transcriptional regulator [Chlorobium sp. KB01]
MSNSLFQKVVEQIPSVTKKYVERQGEFAVKVNELLESTGMTQRELADKLGKKESYVSRILAGWSNPTLKTIVEFEAALGKDIIDFQLGLKREDSEKTPGTASTRKSIVRLDKKTPTLH